MPDRVWNFTPNWSQDVRETLSWLTTVAISPAGVEQRMSLRTAPRRRVEYSSLLIGPERSFFNTAVHAASTETWLLPLWFDCVVLSNPLASGATEITFATAFREFLAGGKALLRTSFRDYEVVEIASVVSNKIVLVGPTAADWPAGTTLYPLRAARLDGDPGLQRHADRTEVATFGLLCTEPNDFSTSLSVLATYSGYPVLEQPPNERDTLNATLARLIETLDDTIGLPGVYNTAGVGLRSQQHAWMLQGLSANAVFRAFLYACRGRTKALWLPSFQADLDLTTALLAADTSILVANCGYTEFTGAGLDNRRDIRIALNDGTSILRRITSSVDNGVTETLVLNSAVGQDIALSDVHRVEFMSLARLDSDAIEIAHHTDISGVSTASIAFRTHLSGRSSNPWTPLPPTDPNPGDDNTPPDPIGTDNVLARVFTSATFDAQYPDNIYPLLVDGVMHTTPETDILFATGGSLRFVGAVTATAVLFIELIATDDNLVPLPADQQPTTWTIEAVTASVKGSVDRNTFLLYSPAHEPVYAGGRLEWAP